MRVLLRIGPVLLPKPVATATKGYVSSETVSGRNGASTGSRPALPLSVYRPFLLGRDRGVDPTGLSLQSTTTDGRTWMRTNPSL